jgi:hypothetical protein
VSTGSRGRGMSETLAQTEGYSPPPKPATSYTANYCEENIYKLIEDLHNAGIRETWDIWAMFISNTNKSVMLWNQQLRSTDGMPVCWDYHVVALVSRKNPNRFSDAWIYDLDSTLPAPLRLLGKLDFDLWYNNERSNGCQTTPSKRSTLFFLQVHMHQRVSKGDIPSFSRIADRDWSEFEQLISDRALRDIFGRVRFGSLTYGEYSTLCTYSIYQTYRSAIKDNRVDGHCGIVSEK